MAEQHSMAADYQNRWKFTGHELDRETGLYYANARYYDPKVSIFISVDPLAEKYPNISPYTYCVNNPIMYIDPDGREIVPAFKKKANELKYNSLLKDLRKNNIFNRIYSDLDSDYDKIIISEFTDYSKRKYPTSAGIYISANFSTFFTSDENFIQLNDDSYYNGFNKAVMYEEFFHAAQSEFGGRYSTQVGKEVEAKIAVAFSVYQSLSMEDRNNPVAVAKALQDFGASASTSHSLIIYKNQEATFRKGVKNYFDGIIGGDLPKVRVDNFRKELSNYGNYLQYNGYGNTLLDGNYNGETPYFDKLIKN